MSWLDNAIIMTYEDKIACSNEFLRSEAKSKLLSKLDILDFKFPDGRVIQVRPSDHVFIIGAISIGGSVWVLKNNKTAYISADELAVALAYSVEMISNSYKEYADALDAM